MEEVGVRMEWGWQESGWAGVLVLHQVGMKANGQPFIRDCRSSKKEVGLRWDQEGAAKEEKDARRRGTAGLVPRTSFIISPWDYFSSSCIFSVDTARYRATGSNKQTVAHSHSAPCAGQPHPDRKLLGTAISYRSSLPWRRLSG